MLRPMSGYELFVWFYGKQTPTNSVTGARFRGNVGFVEITKAIHVLVENGELPSLSIAQEKPEQYWVSRASNGEIPIRKVNGKGPEAWLEEATLELDVPFEETGPMLRFVAIELATGIDLLCVTSHAFSDGMSKIALFTRLAQVLSGQTQSKEALFLPPPMEESLPPAIIGHWLNRVRWWFQAQAMILTSPRRSPRPAPKSSFAPSYFVSFHRRLSGPKVPWLLEKARSQQCSVHGMLAAALLRALGLDGRRRRLSSPVNVRNRLMIPPGKSWGLYLGFVDTEVVVDSNEPFWNFARKVSEKIRGAVQSDEPLMLPGLVRTLSQSLRGRSLLMNLDPGPAKHDLAVSNLGLHAELPAGASTLVEFLGPCVCGDDGERVVGVSIVGDVLGLTLTQRRQAPAEEGIQILDRAVSLLNALSERDGRDAYSTVSPLDGQRF